MPAPTPAAAAVAKNSRRVFTPGRLGLSVAGRGRDAPYKSELSPRGNKYLFGRCKAATSIFPLFKLCLKYSLTFISKSVYLAASRPPPRRRERRRRAEPLLRHSCAVRIHNLFCRLSVLYKERGEEAREGEDGASASQRKRRKAEAEM